jgi:phage terminase large subunit-like protein
VSDYRPHKFQKEFHRSDAKLRVALAGRFGGKTVAGVNEAIAASLNGLNGKLPVPNIGVILSPSDQMAMDDLNPVIDEYLPRWAVRKRTLRRILFNNGSSIVIRSGHNAESLRGMHPHWVYFDEAAWFESGKAFDNMLLALKPEGKMWFTTTPKGYNWLYRKVISHALSGKKVGAGYISDDHVYYVVKWATFQNPHHSKELVEILERSIPDEKFRRQELYADFIAYEGTIYSFTDDQIKADAPNSYTDVVVGVDVGFAHPTVFEVGVLHNNTWYIVKEVVVKGKTARELAQIGKKIVAEYGGSPRFYMSHERPEIRKEFIEHKLRAYMANHDIEYGIGVVKDAFMDGRLKVVNAPLFLEEMKSYHYENGRIFKVDDDACDAVRYLASGIQEPIHAQIVMPKIRRYNFRKSEGRW